MLRLPIQVGPAAACCVLLGSLNPVPAFIARGNHKCRARLARDGDTLLRLRCPHDSLHLLGGVPASAARATAATAAAAHTRSAVALSLDILEEPLEAIREEVALGCQRLRHCWPSQELGVPPNLSQNLVRLSHRHSGIVTPAPHRRLKRRNQARAKVLPELLRHLVLDR